MRRGIWKGDTGKIMLAAMVVLSLQGSWTAAAADIHTYDVISGWGTASATDTGNITVGSVNGWKDGTPLLTVGNPDGGTETVRIRQGINTGHAAVELYGKDIVIENEQEATGSAVSIYSGGQKIAVGAEGYTESVTVGDVLIENGGSVAVDTAEGTLGNLSLFRESSLAVHARDGITFAAVPAEVGGGTASVFLQGSNASFTTEGGTVSMHGYEIRPMEQYDYTTGNTERSRFVVDGPARFEVTHTVLSTKDSDLIFGSQATGGTIQLDGLFTIGSGTSRVGSQAISSLEIATLGAENPGSETYLQAQDITVGTEESASQSAIGGQGKLQIDAGRDVTIHGTVRAYKTGGQAGSATTVIRAGGNVLIDTPNACGGTNSLLANASTLSIEAGGTLSVNQGLNLENEGNVVLQGADVQVQNIIANGDSTLTMTARDKNGNLGNLATSNIWETSENNGKTKVSLLGDVVTIRDASSTNQKSVGLTNADLTITGNHVSLEGYFSTGNSETVVTAADTLLVQGPEGEWSGSSQGFQRIDFGKNAAVYLQGGSHTFGSDTAAVAVNGLVATYGLQDAAKLAITGNEVVLNAHRIDANDTDQTTHEGTALSLNYTTAQLYGSDSVSVNGSIELESGSTLDVQGNQKIILGHFEGDFLQDGVVNAIFSRSSSNSQNDIYIGKGGTGTTLVNGTIRLDGTSNLYLAGETVVLKNPERLALFSNGYSFHGTKQDNTVHIGRDKDGGVSDMTWIQGGIYKTVTDDFGIHGRQIFLEKGLVSDALATTKDATDAWYTSRYNTTENFAGRTEGDTSYTPHDAFLNDGMLSVGEDGSRVSIDGRLLTSAGNYRIAGDTIHIWEGSNANQNIVIADKYLKGEVGTEQTSLVQIDGGIIGYAGSDALTVQGKSILVAPAVGKTAVESDNLPVRIGSSSSDTVEIRGGIWANNGANLADTAVSPGTVTVDGSTIVLSANGSMYGVRADDGASVTVGHEGSVLVARGDMTVTDGGTIDLYASGTSSMITGKMIDPYASQSTGSTESSSKKNRRRMAARLAAAAEESTGGITLHMSDGAVYMPTTTSAVSGFAGAGGVFRLADGTLQDSAVVRNYSNDNSQLLLDIDATTNTGNDRLYVTGTHSGNTLITMYKVDEDSYWSEAITGTVLASIASEAGSFRLTKDTDETPLYFYKAVLDERDSTAEEAAAGYNRQVYLKQVYKTETENGHHTDTVRNLRGVSQSQYLLWRDSMDTLFRRVGDRCKPDAAGSDGIWVRARGSKLSHDGEFGSKVRYQNYEVGYDLQERSTDKLRQIQGIGFSYLNGDTTVADGNGDVKGYAFGMYETLARKDGQYWDFNVKVQRLKNDFRYRALQHRHTGTADATGVTVGAEYGNPIPAGGRWVVEPQAQVTAGWLRPDSFTDSDGVRVEADTVRTAVSRLGARIGYRGKKLQVYAGADWYHDFGGALRSHMTYGSDHLDVRDDLGDSWLEYGMGFSWQVQPSLEIYGEATRGDGNAFDKAWAWNLGVQYRF